ncbi:MAG: hypothetical protein EXR69_00220 [Myxococcales bacterium]|nr:hypothetical protein [Myxococcales bacterium]
MGLARAPGLRPALVAFGVPMVGYGLFRLWYFGDWLPNPARAKIGGLPAITELEVAAAYLQAS